MKGIFTNSFGEGLRIVENYSLSQVLDSLINRINRYRAKSNVMGRIHITTEVLFR